MDKNSAQQEQRAPHSICIDHALGLKKLSASYKSLLSQNRRLFLIGRANELAIKEIRDILGNGLIREVKDLCEQVKEQFNGIETEMNRVYNAVIESEKKIKEMEDEASRGPTGFLRRSWSTFIAQCKAHEWWFWVVVMVFAIWTVGKISLFGEKSDWMIILIKALFG